MILLKKTILNKINKIQFFQFEEWKENLIKY